MAYTCDEAEYPIEHYQQQEEWIMNNKFPQKQNTSEKLKVKQYGAATLICILAAVIMTVIRLIWGSVMFFSVIPVLLAVPCAVAAFYLLEIVWREPPWGFHF